MPWPRSWRGVLFAQQAGWGTSAELFAAVRSKADAPAQTSGSGSEGMLHEPAKARILLVEDVSRSARSLVAEYLEPWPVMTHWRR